MDLSSRSRMIPDTFPFPSSFLATQKNVAQICHNADTMIYKMQTAPVIAFAHLTGWSAELISNTVNKQFGGLISAEMVWDTYKAWEAAWFEKKLDGNTFNEIGREYEGMLQVLAQYGCSPNFEARPLSQTPRPVSHLCQN